MITIDQITMTEQFYQEGHQCGTSAALSRGGTRGAEWFADNRSLTGEERDEFIRGFNDGLDDSTTD